MQLKQRWVLSYNFAFVLLLGKVAFALPGETQKSILGAQIQSANAHYESKEFRAALSEWESILQRHPSLVEAVLKVSELRLLLQGRASSTEVVKNYLRQNGIENQKALQLKKHLSWLQEFFVTEEGQTFYLQGKSRALQGDYPMALSLYEKADEVEKGNTKVLRAKASLEMQQGLYEKATSTLQSLIDKDPFDFDSMVALIENKAFSKDYESIVEILKVQPELKLDFQLQPFLVEALFQTGRSKSAWSLLESSSTKKRSSSQTQTLSLLGLYYQRLFPREDKKFATMEVSLELFDRQLKKLKPSHSSRDPFHWEDKRAQLLAAQDQMLPPPVTP